MFYWLVDGYTKYKLWQSGLLFQGAYWRQDLKGTTQQVRYTRGFASLLIGLNRRFYHS